MREGARRVKPVEAIEEPVELPAPGRVTLTSRIALAQGRMARPGARLAAAEAPAGGGDALPAPLRARMEHAFGADFHDVRVHVDGRAEQIGAQAFAEGSQLHFAAGRYDPASESGQFLIAHELAHVVQQRAGRVGGEGLVIDPALEHEADELGARAMRGEPVARGGGAAPATGRAKQGKDAAAPAITFVDAGYTWRVEADGSFTCIAQPASVAKNSVGAHITKERSPKLWQTLDGLAPAAAPAPAAPAPAAPAPDAGPSLGTRIVDELSSLWDTATDALESVGAKAAELLSPSPAATPDAPAAAPAPAPVAATAGATPAAPGDVRLCANKSATIRDENGKQVGKDVIPLGSYVLVLERKGTLLHVAQLASSTATSGTPLGWTMESNLVALVRPPPKTSAGAQMANLLSVARANRGAVSAGRCYPAVKRYIAAAGGYGDILDMYRDERFAGIIPLCVPAVGFAAAVEKYGAANLGLREVPGLPMDAAPGTLLVTRGTALARQNGVHISDTDGDIAVISGVENGWIQCINDGLMPISADRTKWGTFLQGVLVGMYAPIDRGA